MSKKIFKQHAEFLKVLANPKRLEVMYLLRRGKFTVSDMENMIGIRQANLSQHLMVLRRTGVVTSEHEGRKVYYYLVQPALVRISATLHAIFNK